MKIPDTYNHPSKSADSHILILEHGRFERNKADLVSEKVALMSPMQLFVATCSGMRQYIFRKLEKQATVRFSGLTRQNGIWPSQRIHRDS